MAKRLLRTGQNRTPLHELHVPVKAVHPFNRIKYAVPIKICSFFNDERDLCWVYQGNCPGGYARNNWHNQHFQIHRWSFAYYIRSLEEYEDVHHECKRKDCINPYHLTGIREDYHSYIEAEASRRRGHEARAMAPQLSSLLREGFVVVAVFKHTVLLCGIDGIQLEIEYAYARATLGTTPGQWSHHTRLDGQARKPASRRRGIRPDKNSGSPQMELPLDQPADVRVPRLTERARKTKGRSSAQRTAA